MNPFSYSRATTVADALGSAGAGASVRFIAGGTNLVDLMKYHVEKPTHLVDINRLPLKDMRAIEGGGLSVGALVSNADLAHDQRIQSKYPLLASALLAGASPQLRNAASTGGNLLQRTRCPYFYDVATPCNKREPGTGCPAIHGVNRMHAILGTSEHCIATHPSDMCVALAALEAVVVVSGMRGERRIPFREFHRVPEDRPELDNTLRHGELVTAIELPAPEFASNYSYLKLRDRASYAFALVSVAVGLKIEGALIRKARVALGGVAHKPWRDLAAESMLEGQPAGVDAFERAATQLLSGAKAYSHNGFKIDLARRSISRALRQAAAATPQSQSSKQIR